MAEQLAFDQFRRDGRAVHLDERSRGAGASGVEAARHQLLARAVFARDQYARLRRGDAVDQPADAVDLGRVADDRLGLRGTCAAAAAHTRRCRRGGGRRDSGRVLDRPLNGLQQVVHVDGLGEEILRSVADGPHGRVDRRLGRKGDEGYAGIRNFACRVGEDHVEGNLRAHVRRLLFVFGGLGRETFVFEPLAQRVSHTFYLKKIIYFCPKVKVFRAVGRIRQDRTARAESSSKRLDKVYREGPAGGSGGPNGTVCGTETAI